jgi:hypothetical protein
MRHSKLFATFTMAAGLAVLGAPTLAAQDWRYGYGYAQRQDMREDSRDLNRDYNRVDRMRADIARDRARLDDDIRWGRSAAASHDAADLARDQRALEAQMRDIRHDRTDLRRDYRDWR